MSEDHLVLTEFPLVVSPLELKLSGKPFIQNYRWEPERGLVFHVVEKDTGKLVRTATADATFAFHHVNAFADRDRLAVDVITYPDATIIDQLYLARLRASAPLTATGTLTRFHVPFAGERRSPAAFWRTFRSNCPASITSATPASPTVMSGAPASRPGRLSRFHRQDRYGNRHHRHLARGGSLSGRAGLRALAVRRRPRMTACCSRSCSTSTRSCPSCSCSMRRAWRRSRGRTVPHAIPFHFHGNYFASAARAT